MADRLAGPHWIAMGALRLAPVPGRSTRPPADAVSRLLLQRDPARTAP